MSFSGIMEPSSASRAFYLAVLLRDFVVEMHGLHQREERSNAAKLLLPVFGVMGSVVKLTQNRDGQVQLGIGLYLRTHSGIPAQVGADDVGVEREAIHGSTRSQPSSISATKASASSPVMQPKEASKAACRSAVDR